MYSSLDTTLFSFFFNDTSTTEIYTLSLHDALPISCRSCKSALRRSISYTINLRLCKVARRKKRLSPILKRSEEHTSELQSRQYLVCRLLLEKKKQKKKRIEQMYIVKIECDASFTLF